MQSIADLAQKYAVATTQNEPRIRLTSKQNALILDVPKANVEPLSNALTDAGLPPNAHTLRTNLVSCTGSEFCNLAVVETKHRAGALLRWLEENTRLDVPLFISVTGCPNACAQYQIADIGLTGIPTLDPVKKDAHGKPLKVDGFKVLLGGCIGTNPKFGELIAKKIPADRNPLAGNTLSAHSINDRIDRDEPFATWCSRHEPEYLQKLIVEPTEAPDVTVLNA
jgi:sulfite reductase beta subunit-like hemoprotein